MKQRKIPELTFFFSLFWSLQIKRCWCAYWSVRQQREGLSKTKASGTALTVFKFVSGKMQWLYSLNTHSKVNVSVPLITKERQKNKSGNSRAALQAEKSSSSSREAKIECPQWSNAYPHNKALQRHIRDQHSRKMEATISPGRHLKGACVDFQKGLFMISRTFSGVVYISHSLPAPRQCTIRSQTSIVSSSCELDECVDAARVTRQSGHPAFWMRTVQYRKWSPTANDPETANDPQNGPQMILDRKWSPTLTANDPVKT